MSNTKEPTLLERSAAYQKAYDATEASIVADGYDVTEKAAHEAYEKGVHTPTECDLEAAKRNGIFQALRNNFMPPM